MYNDYEQTLGSIMPGSPYYDEDNYRCDDCGELLDDCICNEPDEYTNLNE